MQTVTLSGSWREAGPVAITAANLRTCVDHFYRARELVTSATPSGSVVPDRVEIRLSPDGRHVSAGQLQILAELTAPALLLLLGPGRDQELRIASDREALRLTAPGPPAEDVMRRVLPVVLGVLRTLLADIRDGQVPAGLVRFPQLVTSHHPEAHASTSVEFAIPAALGRGRMTLLPAPGRRREVRVYAQESLTMLYLHAEDAVRRLASTQEEPGIRRLVSGRAPLPVDPRCRGHAGNSARK